jgi:hypothetical protein
VRRRGKGSQVKTAPTSGKGSQVKSAPTSGKGSPSRGIATETVRQIELWDRYELATFWIHQATRLMYSPRKEFSALYEYLRTNLDFQGIAYYRVPLAERLFLEAETIQVYSDISYQGIIEVIHTFIVTSQQGPMLHYASVGVFLILISKKFVFHAAT